MKRESLFNLISISLLVIASMYLWLVINDNPITWRISEVFICCIPLLFAVAGGLSIASVRIRSNVTAIIVTIISALGFIITLSLIVYVVLLGSAWSN